MARTRNAKPAAANPPGRSPLVETAVPDASDKRTHIERINPGDNPAYIPGAWPAAEPAPKPHDPAHPGPKRRYRLLQTGVHNDARLPAGSVVELYAHEVGAHHELIPEDIHRQPKPEQEPDRVHRHALIPAPAPKPALRAPSATRKRARKPA